MSSLQREALARVGRRLVDDERDGQRRERRRRVGRVAADALETGVS